MSVLHAIMREVEHFLVLQVEELKAHHGWLLNTLEFFKEPNESSKNALSSSRVDVGSHSLDIKPELREIALQVSTHLVCLLIR